MSVTATLPSRPARALGAALLVAGLAGGLLAGAAASAAALQSPATAAAGPDPGSGIRNPAAGQAPSSRLSAAPRSPAAGQGSYTSGANNVNLSPHWDGQSRVHCRTPDPAGSRPGAGNALSAVTCPSATNCWAGGTYGRSALVPQHNRSNQIRHWNGTSWTAA